MERDDSRLDINRLQYAMDLRHMKQVDLVRLTGIGKSAISSYLKGLYLPKQRSAHKLAKALHVNPLWLMGADVAMEDPLYKAPPHPDLIPVNEGNIRRIPILGDIAAGVPSAIDQEYESFIELSEPCKADFALRVSGDSMAPLLMKGDIVYIRQQDDVDDGQIAAVIIDDESTLKHVYHQPDGLLLISENASKYPPMTYSFSDHSCIRIIGLVVGFTRMFTRNSKK
jgi:repressor LexA